MFSFPNTSFFLKFQKTMKFRNFESSTIWNFEILKFQNYFTNVKNSKFEIYLHGVVRNAQGELISVAETSQCKLGMNCSIYLPHEITDYAFDTLLGKKEIITIGDIKYEKVQFNTSSKYRELFDVYDREPTGVWEVEICGEPIKKYGYDCTNIFWSN